MERTNQPRKDYLRGWNAVKKEAENGQVGEHSVMEKADDKGDAHARNTMHG
jgi:hypothetical protein